MAVVLDLTFDAGTQGTAATTGNTAGPTGAFDAMETGLTFDGATAQHGAFGLLSSATASSYARKDFSSTTVSYRVGFRYTNSPTTADVYLFRVGVGTTRYVSVRVVNGTGKLRVEDNASVNRWTAANALVSGTDYWLEVLVDSGTTTSNGKITFDYYPKGSSTPVETGLVDTTANCGAGVTFTRAYMLKYAGSTQTIAFDDVKLTTDFARIGMVSSNGTVTGVAPAITMAARAPVVTSVFGATVAAVVAGLTLGAVAPTIDGEAGVFGGSAIGITVTALAPSVSTVADASVGAVGASCSLAAMPPGVSAQLVASVAPADASVSLAAIAPVASGIAHASVAALPAGVTTTAVAPSFSAGTSVNATVVAAAVTLAAQPPTASSQVQPTLAPSVIGITITGRAPVVTGQQQPPSIVTPAAAATLTARAPAASGQMQPTVDALVADVVIEVLAPDVSAGVIADIQAVPLTLQLAALAPTVWVDLPDTPAGRRLVVRWESRTCEVPYQDGDELMAVLIEHDPNATLDYQFDFTKPDYYGRTWVGADRITDATVTTTASGVDIDNVVHDDGKVTAWVSGGTAGTMVQLKCHITTLMGRSDDRTMLLKVIDR